MYYDSTTITSGLTTTVPSIISSTTPIGYFDLGKSCITSTTFKKKQEPKVVFDGDYTIYHNEYGEKTVVKRMESEQYDKEKAVMYAILKSKGIKLKDIAELIDNSVDNKAAREKRKAKKIKAKMGK